MEQEKTILELMDEWLETATVESFIKDCKEFGIGLEKINEEEYEKNFDFNDFHLYDLLCGIGTKRQ